MQGVNINWMLKSTWNIFRYSDNYSKWCVRVKPVMKRCLIWNLSLMIKRKTSNFLTKKKQKYWLLALSHLYASINILLTTYIRFGNVRIPAQSRRQEGALVEVFTCIPCTLNGIASLLHYGKLKFWTIINLLIFCFRFVLFHLTFLYLICSKNSANLRKPLLWTSDVSSMLTLIQKLFGQIDVDNLAML